ncbi:MAG: nucleotidyltransferase family protein [Candidatus Saccharimonadales bacterium]
MYYCTSTTIESAGVNVSEAPIGYINAGGRGTRLNGLFTPDPNTGIAKALLSIGDPGVRLVDHHITNLRQQNIEHIVIAAGDQPEVYEYIRGTYTDDTSVIATRSIDQLGTGGDLVEYSRSNEDTSLLLVQNVDTILDVDLQDFSRSFEAQRQLGAVASIALTLNKGVPNEDAYMVAGDGRVLHSAEFSVNAEDQPGDYRASSTGAVMITAEFLRSQRWQKRDGQLSFYGGCLKDAWMRDGLYAHNNKYRFFRDVGTIATWQASQADVELQSQLRYN